MRSILLASTFLWMVIIMGTSCKTPQGDKITIDGTLTGASGKMIMLAEMPFNTPNRIILDSATLDSSGHFLLQAIQGSEGIYQLFVPDGPGFLLINDVHKIQFSASLNDPGNYTVEGSPASKSMKSLYEQFTTLHTKWIQSAKLSDSLQLGRTTDDSTKMALQVVVNNNRIQLENFLTRYLQTEPNATACWYAMGLASQVLSKEKWSQALAGVVEKFPRHPGITLMKVSLAAAEGAASQGKQWLYKQVPDITLPDTAGQPLSVSDFRGKWLLIDFWASWCSPCRQQNPKLVEAYQKLSRSNFQVLGISLDKAREPWMEAIAADSLAWPQASDLQFWDSRAVNTYGIEALPFNILVDPKGIVKAVNLQDSLLLPTLIQLVR